MKSKLELRIEAARVAATVKDVTAENIVEVSERIEKYLLGCAELPETYDADVYIKQLITVMNSLNNHTLGVDPNLLKVFGYEKKAN